jgi:glycosyltransferase involved in cell wall biosynthesis
MLDRLNCRTDRLGKVRFVSEEKKLMIVCLSPNRGGMEMDAFRFFLRQSNRMRTTFFCEQDTFLHESLLTSSASTDKFFATSFYRFFARAIVSPGIVFGLRQFVKKEKPDLIVFFGTSEIKSIAIALLGFQVKLIVRLGTTISRPKDGFFQKIFYSRVNGFIATSQHIKRNILDIFPVSKSCPVEVVYPVVRAIQGQPRGGLVSRPRNIKLIYHSRFVRGKGQLDAVKAFALVHSNFSAMTLTLVGHHEDLAYVAEIRNFLTLNGLLEKVVMLSNSDDVDQLLRGADIFLAPSYGEGFSNSFAEAMSAGLLAITYRNTVFPEFRELGFDFIICDQPDVNLLADCIDSAIKLIASNEFDGSKNKKLVGEIFSEVNEFKTLTNF